jgi:hypothetical protein
MRQPDIAEGHPTRMERARRMLIIAIIAAVIVAPGIVAVAMILTGNVGD